jgi:hypothetical protein
MAKTLENTSIDDLVNFIEDKSKTCKKKKQKETKNENTISKEEEKRIKKERKEKLNKYNRDKNPLYKKNRGEQQLVKDEYMKNLKMMKDYEDSMKEQRMKEIMEIINDPEKSEESKKEFINNLMRQGEIEMNKNDD